MASEGLNVFDAKQEFYVCFNSLLSRKREDNSMYFTSDKYNEIVEQVKQAKLEKKKSALSYRRLKRYDVIRVGDEDKLITALKEGETDIKYYVRNEDMYDVLHEAHVNIGHGGKHKMLAELKRTYRNVTQEVVLLYLKFCVPCNDKSSQKKCLFQPMVFAEMNSRGQVDVLDMKTRTDGQFRFIMVYEDYLTKFVQLRPLISNEAKEVAKQLLDIFCIFGAPSFLQSDKGRKFVQHVIMELKIKWTNLTILVSKDQSECSVKKAYQSIPNILDTWMQTEKTGAWSEGLRFVQIIKNRTYHEDLRKSPYQAVFGCEFKIGLSTTPLPREVASQLETEEDLEELLCGMDANKGDNESDGNEEILSDVPRIETVMCGVCNSSCTDDYQCESCHLIVHISCCKVKSGGDEDESCLICKLCIERNIVYVNREFTDRISHETKKIKLDSVDRDCTTLGGVTTVIGT